MIYFDLSRRVGWSYGEGDGRRGWEMDLRNIRG